MVGMKYRVMLALGVALLGPIASMTPASAGGVRYVVPPKDYAPGDTPLWRGWLEARQCGRAILNKADLRQWCEEGTTPGVKPKIGTLPRGSEVAVIDSSE